MGQIIVRCDWVSQGEKSDLFFSFILDHQKW